MAENSGPEPRPAYYQRVRTAAGWHVRLVAGNGEIVMTSEVYQGRDGKRSAEQAIGVARGALPATEVVDEREAAPAAEPVAGGES